MTAPENNDPRVTALGLALRVLSTIDSQHWICNGTLLGLIRDGQLIQWDGDIDIGIKHDQDRDLVTRTLALHGFNLIDDGAGTDYLTFAWKGIRVDLNFFRPVGTELVTLWRVPRNLRIVSAVRLLMTAAHIPVPNTRLLWVREGYAIPRSAVFPIRIQSFLGIDMPVPHDSRAVLAYIYGPDWGTPKRDYDWRRDGENNAHGSLE